MKRYEKIYLLLLGVAIALLLALAELHQETAPKGRNLCAAVPAEIRIHSGIAHEAANTLAQ